jgi:hypothetical protein
VPPGVGFACWALKRCRGAQYRKICGSGSEAQYLKVCARGSRLNTVNFMQEFHPPVWTLNSADVVHQRSGAELTSDLTQTGALPIAARACLTEAINGSASIAGSDPVRSPGRTMRHKKSVQCSSRLSRPLGGNGQISIPSVVLTSRIFCASQAGWRHPL